MPTVKLIGMGLGPADLTPRHRKAIEEADILVGGQRLLAFFSDHPGQKVLIDKNLRTALDLIAANHQQARVVVLASGDPLFYGIGGLLIKTLGPQNVTIYPNITTVAAAFARIKQPWQDVRVVSLHGRRMHTGLDDALRSAPRVAVYTDPQQNPAWLGDWLVQRGWAGLRMWVLEQLGTSSESIRELAPQEAAQNEFSVPNIVILENPAFKPAWARPVFGRADDAYVHQEGLITKAEVRAVTLSKLQLRPHQTMWDLGAGSGSVSIEAAAFISEGQVIAVERNPARIEQIEANRRRFGITNLKILQMALPQGLDQLPAPNRIFIGGGGKDLAAILQAALECLQPGGIVVINTVLIANLEAAVNMLAAYGLQTQVVQLQVNRSRTMPWSERLEALNPVWIVTGMSKGDNDIEIPLVDQQREDDGER
jgi:precorrin-6Y C5,15-methyltransferase (decarboxylating)